MVSILPFKATWWRRACALVLTVVAAPAWAQFSPQDCATVVTTTAPEGAVAPDGQIEVPAMPGALGGEVACYLQDDGAGGIQVLPVEILPNGTSHFSILYSPTIVNVAIGHPDEEPALQTFLWCATRADGSVRCTVDLFSGAGAVFYSRTRGADGNLRRAGVIVDASAALEGSSLRDPFLAAAPEMRRVAFRLAGVFDGLPMVRTDDTSVLEFRFVEGAQVEQVVRHLESEDSGITVHFAVLDGEGGGDIQQLSQPHEIVSVLMWFMQHFEWAMLEGV
jgi:hypothetical protein